MTRFGIYPPRYAGSSIYYKDIIVFEVTDEKVTNAWQYNLDGTSHKVPTTWIEYDPKMSTDYKGIVNPSDNIINSTIRTTWLFTSRDEAFVSKLLLLQHLRNYFIRKQNEQKSYFDSKVPPEIGMAIEHQRKINPEVFL